MVSANLTVIGTIGGLVAFVTLTYVVDRADILTRDSPIFGRKVR